MKFGDDLESERYLIIVEEVKVVGSRVVESDGFREVLELGLRTFVFFSRFFGC